MAMRLPLTANRAGLARSLWGVEYDPHWRL